MNVKRFTLKGELDDDDAYVSFGEVRDGEVCGNVMIEDERIDGYVVLDLDVNNRIVGIEIIGVSTVIRDGVVGILGKAHPASPAPDE